MCAISNISGSSGKYDNVVNNSSVRWGRNAVNNFNNYLSNYTQPTDELDQFKPNENDSADEKIEKANALLDKINEQNNKRSPIGFVYQYLPTKPQGNNIDTDALLGAAYEEMGAQSVAVEDMNKKVQAGLGEKMSAEALDLNKDGQIDVAEYSTSILLADALSPETEASTDGKQVSTEQQKTEQENTIYDKLTNLYEKAQNTVDNIQTLDAEAKGELEKIEALSKLKLDETHVLNSTNTIDGTITTQGQNLLTPYGSKENKEIAYKTYSYLYDYYNLGAAKDKFLSDENNLSVS